MDARLRRKLRDFGRALCEAISDSSEATRRLNDLRDEGFSLYLLLDGSGEDAGEGEGAGETRLETRGGGRSSDRAAGSRGTRTDRREATSEALARVPRRLPAARQTPEAPEFRINGEDLAMLRALGIDPTRTLRRRKS